MEPNSPRSFEAIITPQRSLSPGMMRTLLAAIGLLCVASATLFVSLGAWPVGGFTGLELLLAAYLIRLHIREGRASELILLSPAALRIIRTNPAGQRQEITLEPTWLRIDLTERPGRTPALTVGARRQRHEIAAALGSEQKRDLATALDAALYALQNPRYS